MQDTGDSLRGRIIDSYVWVGISSIVSRSFSMVATLILAGILVPEDFGVVSLANLITSALGLFRDFGMNQAIIYQKRRLDEALDAATVLSVSVSVILFSIGWLLAHPAALFFKNPAVEDVVKVLPFSLVITAFSSIQVSHLEKELDFKKRALPEIVSFGVYLPVSVGLALLGLKYWSIIFGNLIQSIVYLILCFCVSRWHPRFRLDFGLIKEMVGFGKYVMSSTILNFIFRNVDTLTVGRVLGTTALGFYDLAYRIGNITTTQITHVVAKVFFPASVKMSDDTRVMAASYLKTFWGLSLATIPVALGIITYAPHFFTLFYGLKWERAVLPTQIMAVYGLSRALFSPIGAVLLALGRARELMLLSFWQTVAFVILIVPVVTRFDLVGLSVLIVFVNLCSIAYAIFLVERHLVGTSRSYIKIMFTPFVVGIVTIVLPLHLWVFFSGGLTLLSFFLLIFVSGCLYCGITMLTEKELIGTMREIAGRIRAEKPR
jgi:O-antigen/teichoic acid export membrane protein